MALKVHITNGVNIPNVETFGKSDPYVTVEYQGKFCRQLISYIHACLGFL